MSSIIIYYSREGENYFNGTLRHVEKGNTEIVAEKLQSITGADLFRVEQRLPYSSDYNQCIAQAMADQRNEARPSLISIPENLDQYDTVYLGYPNYWGTMPMAMFTLLEEIELAGKTIRPFCTHEGSGLGNSQSDIKRYCVGATISKGLSIHGSDADNADAEIIKWLH